MKREYKFMRARCELTKGLTMSIALLFWHVCMCGDDPVTEQAGLYVTLLVTGVLLSIFGTPILSGLAHIARIRICF